MKNKVLGFSLICAMFALSLAWFYRLHESSEPTFAAAPDVSHLPPPDQQTGAAYPVVNRQRLQALAGEPYNGPSYKVDHKELQEMIAEKKRSQNRVPASRE